MNKFLVKMSFSLMLAAPLITVAASADPTVTLNTTSLGYPYNNTFQVNVQFSQPVYLVEHGTSKTTGGSDSFYSLQVVHQK